MAAVDDVIDQVLLFDAAVEGLAFLIRFAVEDRRQIQLLVFPVVDVVAHGEVLALADHLVDGAEAQFGHLLAQFLLRNGGALAGQVLKHAERGGLVGQCLAEWNGAGAKIYRPALAHGGGRCTH